MSTRSQLRFVQRVDTDRRIAQVYRHSDGYPDRVLRDLARLKQLLDATRTERGPGYAAAQFVFVDKLATVGLYLDRGPDRSVPADLLDPANMAHLDQPLFLLGHGVENPADGIHGDEEYLYVVELPARAPGGIAGSDPDEWRVKVSEHRAFPRWDGPTDDAFDRATWQFEGPLPAAIDEWTAGSDR